MRYQTWATLTVIPLTVLVGCSGKAGSADPTGASSDGNTAGWKAGTDKVSFGLIGPMTGPFAVLGISQQNSLNVVIDQINKEGGIGGAQVVLETRDSGLDPGKAVQQANEFAGNQQVKMVVGPSITSFYNAAKGAFEQNKMINCQPAVAAGTFADLKYGFRSQDPNALNVDKMLAYLKTDAKVKKVGLIYEADDTGSFFDQQFRDKAPQQGLEYVGWEKTVADDASHLAYVQALKAKGAEAIWISTNPAGAKTMAAKKAAGYDGILMGGSGLFNIAFIEAAGDAAAGTVFSSSNYPWLLRDRASWQAGYRTHIEAIEKKYGVNVGPKSGATSPKGTAIAADCAYAYAKAAEQAKSLDADKVAQALEALHVPSAETPSGNSINPGKNHEFYGIDDIHLYKWEKDAKGWFATEVTPK
ncbi:MAG: ABC transporter substrate-binding protein [Knoellia sp.]